MNRCTWTAFRSSWVAHLAALHSSCQTAFPLASSTTSGVPQPATSQGLPNVFAVSWCRGAVQCIAAAAHDHSQPCAAVASARSTRQQTPSFRRVTSLCCCGRLASSQATTSHWNSQCSCHRVGCLWLLHAVLVIATEDRISVRCAAASHGAVCSTAVVLRGAALQVTGPSRTMCAQNGICHLRIF